MFQFPASPVIGQIFSPIPGVSYKFNGTGWEPFAQGALTRGEAEATYIPLAQRAAANGVATLDAGIKVPMAQIPALVAREVVQPNGGHEVLINGAAPGNYPGPYSGIRIDDLTGGTFIDLMYAGIRSATWYTGAGLGGTVNISAMTTGPFQFGVGNPGNFQIFADGTMLGPDGVMASENAAIAYAIALG